MVSFREEVEAETSDVEFLRLDLNHFRTVNKDNEIKPNEPEGDNYNRSDRLAFDLSPITRPELSLEEFRALNVKPVWQLYWDGRPAYKVRHNPNGNHSHNLEFFDVKNKSAQVSVANKNFFNRTWGHVIVVTTEPGGSNRQHKVGLQAFEAGLETDLFEYYVMGDW